MLKQKKHHTAMGGFTLVELMIGLVVGMIILLSASAVYVNTSRGSMDTLRATRLNQDMRSAMDLMVADIRRAGYWSEGSIGASNPFNVRTAGNATDIFISTNCVLYSYDFNDDGSVNANGGGGGDEFFGFRLNAETNTLQMIDPTQTLSDTSASCDDDDAETSWVNLTDPQVIRVSALSFTTEGSECVNATTGAAPWVVEANQTIPACLATSTTQAANWVSPGTGEDLVEIRRINITLTAEHMNDSTLTRTLTEVIQVRNNRVIVN